MKYLFLCLLQTVAVANPQPPKPRPYSQIEQTASEFESFDVRTPLDPQDALRQQAKFEEDEFVKRLHNLLNVLRDFSTSYNDGHVINVKKVKEVRKALHELEKSDWFKSYKAN
jgi:hypothetical protein